MSAAKSRAKGAGDSILKAMNASEFTAHFQDVATEMDDMPQPLTVKDIRVMLVSTKLNGMPGLNWMKAAAAAIKSDISKARDRVWLYSMVTEAKETLKESLGLVMMLAASETSIDEKKDTTEWCIAAIANAALTSIIRKVAIGRGATIADQTIIAVLYHEEAGSEAIKAKGQPATPTSSRKTAATAGVPAEPTEGLPAKSTDGQTAGTTEGQLAATKEGPQAELTVGPQATTKGSQMTAPTDGAKLRASPVSAESQPATAEEVLKDEEKLTKEMKKLIEEELQLWLRHADMGYIPVRHGTEDAVAEIEALTESEFAEQHAKYAKTVTATVRRQMQPVFAANAKLLTSRITKPEGPKECCEDAAIGQQGTECPADADAADSKEHGVQGVQYHRAGCISGVGRSEGYDNRCLRPDCNKNESRRVQGYRHCERRQKD